MINKEKRYRLFVCRSNRNLAAQIIDPDSGEIVFGAEDGKLLGKEEIKGKTKVQRAEEFGLKFAQAAKSKKVELVYFDRGDCLFHGRVKAFAQGARKGGLNF